VTADAVQLLFRARVDHAVTHRVVVRFFGILMARHAQFKNIGCLQEALVVAGVYLMARAAIFEGRFVLKFAGEFSIAVTRKAGLRTFFDLKGGTEANVRSVTTGAAILVPDRSVHNRFSECGGEVLMAAETECSHGLIQRVRIIAFVT